MGRCLGTMEPSAVRVSCEAMPMGATTAWGMCDAWRGRRGRSHPLAMSGNMRLVRASAEGPEADLWLPYRRAAVRSEDSRDWGKGDKGYEVPWWRMYDVFGHLGWEAKRWLRTGTGRNSDPYAVGAWGWSPMMALRSKLCARRRSKFSEAADSVSSKRKGGG